MGCDGLQLMCTSLGSLGSMRPAGAMGRMRILLTVISAVVIAAAACACAGSNPAVSKSNPESPNTSASGVPQAAVMIGTLRLSPSDSESFAAIGQRAFAVVVPPQGPRIRVMEIAGDGRVIKQRWQVVGHVYANDIWDVSAGPDGLYVGTAVLHRFFPHVPDELLRIDPTTLAIVAKATFPAPVSAVEQGQELWASIGDGRVLRLDPQTLAIRASRRVAPKPSVATAALLSLSAPALGAGSLWVLVGDGRGHLELVRLDPTSLAVRSRTPVYGHGSAIRRGSINAVAAGNDGAYLWGDEIVPVDAGGAIEGRPVSEPGLQTLAVDGSTLVALVGAPGALVELNAQGRLLARTALRDSSAELAVSGRDAWFMGDAGGGNGIVHVRLNLP